ncbi:MAG: lamin tail domain-containing protein, partial [Cyclobacteriaceae bacterium]|nr:lamin tail domain-containing protein [Cyclobacteriaceae bacterium]
MKNSSLLHIHYLSLLAMLAFNPNAISQPSSLYINEFQASNISTLRNPLFFEYSDWLEIYNAGTAGVNIQGFFLSDDPDDPQKWEIPLDSTIHPDGYMLFWADDYNAGIHTNFKLSRSGEFLGLFDPDGNVVDSVSFGYQEDDISYGRLLNDLRTWVYFDEPTPGRANPEAYFEGRSENPLFSVTGGFYPGGQHISLYTDDPAVEIRYSLDGTVPDETDPLYDMPIIIDSTAALRVRSFT